MQDHPLLPRSDLLLSADGSESASLCLGEQ